MSTLTVNELNVSAVRPSILLCIGDSCTRLDQIAHMRAQEYNVVLVLLNGVELALDPPTGMTPLDVIRRFRLHMTTEGLDLTAPVGGEG